MTLTRYPWGHFAYGSQHQAWCNVCDSEITIWTQGWGTEGLPPATRKKITAHMEGHQ